MRNFLTCFFVFYVFIAFGQDRYYSNPIKIPMLLSGSFGELRNNHFHSGIDIKTNGGIGEPVYSVADGYVSRISVSPNGFGKAIYINHPNGTTSVYGHLNNFRSDINNYIKDIQYDKKTFRIDVNVPPEKFQIKKNDQIAKSGNSGSSGGPHLHFEIRDTKSEEPVNPLMYDFPISDKKAPKIFSVLLAPLSDSSHINYKTKRIKYPVIFVNGKYIIKYNLVIPVFGAIGFAVHANDYFEDSPNKCGINSLELIIDDELYYAYQINRFSFSDTRFINSHIVYDEYISNKIRYQKTWIDPGNQLECYSYTKGNGIYIANDGQIHNVSVILKDTYGNTTELNFRIESIFDKIEPSKSKFDDQFQYNHSNKFEDDQFQLFIPEGALYDNLNFQYNKSEAPVQYYSNIHSIHKNTTPLHKSAKIRIKPINLSKSLESKALLINVDTFANNFFSIGGEFKNDWVESSISNFGNYAISVDTIPPKIVALSINNRNTLTETNRIRFTVSDELSGINNIEGFIDGNWILFDYDAKNNRITHYFDSKRYALKKHHAFVLKVTDYKNNTSVYEAGFWR